MNDGLVNVSPRFLETDYNFWDDNMQLAVMKPFSDLYDRDEDELKKKSSKEMVVIYFMCDPDPEENKFYRIPFKNRLQMLKETFYADFNENDMLIKKCIDTYPHLALSAVKRALKEEIDSMVDRGIRIRNFDYENASLEEIMKMDRIRGLTLNLAKNYEQLENMFLQNKGNERVKGGRNENKAERKLL